MMNKEKLKKISRNLSANSNDFMSAFRKNMFMYIEEKDITIKEISDEADVPFPRWIRFCMEIQRILSYLLLSNWQGH